MKTTLVTYLEPDGMRMTSSLESVFVSPLTVTLASPSWKKDSVNYTPYFGFKHLSISIQLFRERLSHKTVRDNAERHYR